MSGEFGFRMSMWMFTIGNLCGTFSSDIVAHDVYNSIGKAAKRSGVWMIILEICLALNYTDGPFHSQGNLQSFLEGVLNCLAFIRKDSRLWKDVFYKQVAKDYGMKSSSDYGTDEHFQSVLDTVRADPMMHKGGDLVKLSRWGSIWDRWDEKLDTQWSAK